MKILLVGYNKNFFILSIIILLVSLPSTILSPINQTQINISEIELFESFNKYNETNSKLEKLLPVFQKIKFNFIIKISFSKLIHLKNKIDTQINNIQKN